LTVIGPAFGCGNETIMPRRLEMGALADLGHRLDAPAGTPALSSRASHSSAGRAPRISLRSGTSTFRLVTPVGLGVEARGPLMRSLALQRPARAIHSELLATPSVMYTSCALKTS